MTDFSEVRKLYNPDNRACRECDFASEGVWWGAGRCTLGEMKYDKLLDCPILIMTFFPEE